MGPLRLATPTTAHSLDDRARSHHALEDHWITVDGARMRFLREGTGSPLILLHGLLGYSFSWRYAIPALAQHADVHAVDMLGVGFSDRPPGLDCCLRASAERLLRFLDAAGIPSCDLLGTSHGGAVAMRAASLAPDRIRRLVLVAPANPWSQHGRRMAAFLSTTPVNWLFPRVAPFLQVTHDRLLRRLYGDPSRIRPGTLEGYSAPLAQPGAFKTGLSILRTWDRDLEELRQNLPRIAQIPTLMVWGDRDNAVDPDSAEILCRQFAQCRLLMLPGVGHLPYEEAPEEFNQAVVQFLTAPFSN